MAPGGRRIAAGGGIKDSRWPEAPPGDFRVWDAAGDAQPRVVAAHHDRVSCLAFSRDGRHLATGGDDGAVWLWDVVTGQELVSLPAGGASVLAVAFSPDGRRLGAGGADGVVRVWDARPPEG
jgi:WD40 repeat protein